MENGALAPMSKCSTFYNIFKYMIFQRHQKALLWSKGLNISLINKEISNRTGLLETIKSKQILCSLVSK